MQIPDSTSLALFIDFDGTLVDIAATPDAVIVPPSLRQLLADLNRKLDGSLALITGRALASLDALLKMPELCAAGCHGAEWRFAGTPVQRNTNLHPDLDIARQYLSQFASQNELLFEDKSHSLALHYRNKPDFEAHIDQWLSEHIAPLQNLRRIDGKYIREIQLQGFNKGFAIARFMQAAPFRQKSHPVYIGDDTTDEDGFLWVNQHQGLSIKVGEGPSCAQYRFDNTGQVIQFLNHLLVER